MSLVLNIMCNPVLSQSVSLLKWALYIPRLRFGHWLNLPGYYLTRDPVTSRLLHVDFYQVSMTVKMRADVPVVLTGVSDAVLTFGGVLLQMLEKIAVEGLPADIPTQFEVDVSTMAQLEDAIHVRDLPIDAAKVTLHTDLDVVVARVASPRLAAVEEVPAEAAAPAAGAIPAPAAPPAP